MLQNLPKFLWKIDISRRIDHTVQMSALSLTLVVYSVRGYEYWHRAALPSSVRR